MPRTRTLTFSINEYVADKLQKRTTKSEHTVENGSTNSPEIVLPAGDSKNIVYQKHVGFVDLNVEKCPHGADYSCFEIVALVFYGILGVVAIVIGAIYLDECKGQTLIPIYLLVDGISTLISISLSLYAHHSQSATVFFVRCMCQMLTFGWLVCGTYWVFEIFGKKDADDELEFCNPTLYWFAFAYIIFYCTLYGMLAMVCCCCFCCLLCVLACIDVDATENGKKPVTVR